MASWMAATASASSAASSTRRSLQTPALAPGGCTGIPPHVAGMAFETRMHMIAVGPTMSCGLLPVAASASGPRKPV